MLDLEEMDYVIKVTLLRCGIKCDSYGFKYLHLMICEAIKHNLTFKNKDLYIIVAKICKLEKVNFIEVDIQHAINRAYNLRGFNIINELFNDTVISPDHKPSIGEFVKLIGLYYTLGLYKKDPAYELVRMRKSRRNKTKAN